MNHCPHCRYLPARHDRGGYCSWDCHDHAYEGPPGRTPPERAPTLVGTAGEDPRARVA